MRTCRWRQLVAGRSLRGPSLRQRRLPPGGEKEQLALAGDALEDFMIDETFDPGIEESGCGGRAAPRAIVGRRPFADRHRPGRTDLRLVEALLGQLLALRGPGVGGDLTDAQMIVLEQLEPSLFLGLVMQGQCAPANDGLLVAPDGEGEQTALPAPAAESLIVDESVDLLERGLQRLGDAQIVVPALGLRLDFEDHREHGALTTSGNG